MLISFDIRVFHSSDIYGLSAVPMILKISGRDQPWNKRARLRGDDLCKMQSLSISKVWPWLQNQLYVYSSSILHWFCVSLPMIYNQSKKSNWRRKKTHFYETYSNIVSLILLQHWQLMSCTSATILYNICTVYNVYLYLWSASEQGSKCGQLRVFHRPALYSCNVWVERLLNST